MHTGSPPFHLYVSCCGPLYGLRCTPIELSPPLPEGLEPQRARHPHARTRAQLRPVPSREDHPKSPGVQGGVAVHIDHRQLLGAESKARVAAAAAARWTRRKAKRRRFSTGVPPGSVASDAASGRRTRNTTSSPATPPLLRTTATDWRAVSSLPWPMTSGCGRAGRSVYDRAAARRRRRRSRRAAAGTLASIRLWKSHTAHGCSGYAVGPSRAQQPAFRLLRPVDAVPGSRSRHWHRPRAAGLQADGTPSKASMASRRARRRQTSCAAKKAPSCEGLEV